MKRDVFACCALRCLSLLLCLYFAAARDALLESSRVLEIFEWSSVSSKPVNACNSFSSTILLDAATLIFTDAKNHVVCRLSKHVHSSGIIDIIGGQIGKPGCTDGPTSAAFFHRPVHLAVDPYANLYVADEGNGAVRRITPQGFVETVAGRSDCVPDGQPTFGNAFGDLQYLPDTCSLLLVDKERRNVFSVALYPNCQNRGGNGGDGSDGGFWQMFPYLFFAVFASFSAALLLFSLLPNDARMVSSRLRESISLSSTRVLALCGWTPSPAHHSPSNQNLPLPAADPAPSLMDVDHGSHLQTDAGLSTAVGGSETSRWLLAGLSKEDPMAIVSKDRSTCDVGGSSPSSEWRMESDVAQERVGDVESERNGSEDDSMSVTFVSESEVNEWLRMRKESVPMGELK